MSIHLPLLPAVAKQRNDGSVLMSFGDPAKGPHEQFDFHGSIELAQAIATAYADCHAPDGQMSRLRGAMAADDERLRLAAARVGIHAGCEAPEMMADEIERLRSDVGCAIGVTDEMVERMKDAVEGECDGLAINDHHARAILEYVLMPSLAQQKEPPPPVPHVACPCTLIEQDADCPVGYPSLLCGVCEGKGHTTQEQVTALACEMIKIASDIGGPEDPFAAWESMDLIKSQNEMLRKALEPFAKASIDAGTYYHDTTQVSALSHVGVLLTLGSLRVASAALATTEGSDNG